MSLHDKLAFFKLRRTWQSGPHVDIKLLIVTILIMLRIKSPFSRLFTQHYKHLSQAPHTETPTPWHQDESYWLDMPDKRAASCWVYSLILKAIFTSPSAGLQ